MRKLLIPFIVFMFLFSASSLAAPSPTPPSNNKQIGVFIIGDPSFRINDFYKIVQDKLKDRFTHLIVGDEPQGKYRKYWDDKGLLKEPELPTRQDLFDFVKTTSYEQALVLIITDADISKRQEGYYNKNIGYNSETYTQVNIRARAMLIDTQTLAVIADKEVVQKGPESEFGQLSAKRGCFRKAMEYFKANL